MSCPIQSDRQIVNQRETSEAEDQQEESLRIYVGNLQHEFNEGDVRELFNTHGQVDSVAIIRDHDTRRSKGFAFVEMPLSIQAKAAIKALNGQKFYQPTRTLTVHEAQPRPERNSGVSSAGFGNRGSGGFVSRNNPWSGGPRGTGSGSSNGGGSGPRGRRGDRGSRW